MAYVKKEILFNFSLKPNSSYQFTHDKSQLDLDFDKLQ